MLRECVNGFEIDVTYIISEMYFVNIERSQTMDIKEKLLEVDLLDYNLSERELLLGAAVKYYIMSKEKSTEILNRAISHILELKRRNENNFIPHRVDVNGKQLNELINAACRYCSSEILGQINSVEKISGVETSPNNNVNNEEEIFTLEVSKGETNEYLSAMNISTQFITFLAACKIALI